ncbi:MAG: hypothetical protein KDE54_05885, partial [Caldilineaceae bacterium]|nr:hypothetical protein [Caldilineaceae bacterium]
MARRRARGTMVFMPSILHATWLPSAQPPFVGDLFLWAEEIDFATISASHESDNAKRPSRSHPQQDALAARSPSARSLSTRSTSARSDKARSDGKARAAQIPSHPWQMTLGRLRGYLPVQFPSLARVETQLASTVIWLP